MLCSSLESKGQVQLSLVAREPFCSSQETGELLGSSIESKEQLSPSQEIGELLSSSIESKVQPRDPMHYIRAPMVKRLHRTKRTVNRDPQRIYRALYSCFGSLDLSIERLEDNLLLELGSCPGTSLELGSNPDTSLEVGELLGSFLETGEPFYSFLETGEPFCSSQETCELICSTLETGERPYSPLELEQSSESSRQPDSVLIYHWNRKIMQNRPGGQENCLVPPLSLKHSLVRPWSWENCLVRS